jgi:hypothetical protein
MVIKMSLSKSNATMSQQPPSCCDGKPSNSDIPDRLLPHLSSMQSRASSAWQNAKWQVAKNCPRIVTELRVKMVPFC